MKIENNIQEMIKNLGDDFNILNYVYNNNEFIPGKTPVYYSGPYWDKKEIVVAVKALLTGKWISSGENVHKFEIKFSKKFKQNFAVMVNSGSSANLVMIAALKKYFGWKDNDEIIVSVVGFPTTVSSIVQNRLKPVFVDIEMNSLNFDLDKVFDKMTSRTRAIFVSPVLGNPPNFNRLIDMCEMDTHVVLDNCDSLGSKWGENKYLNEYAIASSYSFYAAHHLCTGEGGMVTSNNEEIIKIARSFAWWGRDCYCVGAANLLPNGTCQHRFDTWLAPKYNDPIDHKYYFVNMGYNLKPLDLQGAIGLVQLEKFDEIEQKRRNSFNKIHNLFMRYVDVDLPSETVGAHTSWFGVPIICRTKEQKQKLVAHLEKNKIQTRNYFAGNILLHPAYSHLDDANKYPNANKVLDLVFFVGASPHYTDEIFNYFEDVLATL